MDLAFLINDPQMLDHLNDELETLIDIVRSVDQTQDQLDVLSQTG